MAQRGNPAGRYFDRDYNDYDGNDYDDNKAPNPSRLSARGAGNPFDNSNFARRSNTHHRRTSYDNRSGRNTHYRDNNAYAARPPRSDHRGNDYRGNAYRSDYAPHEGGYGARAQRHLPEDTQNLERSFRSIHDRFERDRHPRREFRDAENSMDRAFKREAVLEHDPTWGPNRKRTRHVPGGAISKRKNVEEFLDVDLYCELCSESFRTPSEKTQHDNSKKHNDNLMQSRAASVAERADAPPPAAPPRASAVPRNLADTDAQREKRRKRRDEMLALCAEYIGKFKLEDCPKGFREWAARSIQRAKEMDRASPGGNMQPLVNKEIVYVWVCHYRNGTLRQKSWSREPYATGEDLRLFNDDAAEKAPVFDKKDEEAVTRAPPDAQKKATAAAAAAAAAEEDAAASPLLPHRGPTHFISDNAASQHTDIAPSSVDGEPASATAAAPLAPSEPELVYTEPKREFALPASARQVLRDVQPEDVSNIAKFYALRTNSLGKGVVELSAGVRSDAEVAEERATLRALMDKVDLANRKLGSVDYEYDEVFALLQDASDGLHALGSRMHLLRKCLRQMVHLAIEYAKYTDLAAPLSALVKSFWLHGDWNMEKDGEFVFHWLVSLTLLATTHKTDVVRPLRVADELELASQLRMLPRGARKEFVTNEAISLLGYVFANNWSRFFERYRNSLVHNSYHGNTRLMADALVDTMRERALVTMLARNRIGGRAFAEPGGVKDVPTLPMGEVMDWLGYGGPDDNGQDFAFDGAKEFIERLPQDIKVFQAEDKRAALVVGTNEVGAMRKCEKVNLPMLMRWSGGLMEVREFREKAEGRVVAGAS